MQELAGKVAVVTGGGSGIGEGMARAFAEERMRVVIADIDLAEAERVARDLGDQGVEALGVRVDVTDPDDVAALADRVYAELGTADVLCNNAGVLLFGPVADMRVDDWRWVFSVNVFGVVHGITAFLPRMKAQGTGAHIVNTGSPASFGGGPGAAVYSASKNAVLAISEALRAELQADGIGVSILCPSNVNTRILDSQRNRSAEFGDPAAEPFGTGPNHPVGAMDTIDLGRMVCAAIRDGSFYVFNTAEMLRPRLEQRWAELLAALNGEATPPAR